MRRLHTERRVAAAAWLLFVLGTAARAGAQCAMCGSGTAYAGPTPARSYATFLTAALVLLVPALGLAGGILAQLWKHRR